mgnify:FL=1
MTATITNGATESTNYTQDFDIAVSAPTYIISLSETGTLAFSATAGYSALSPSTITVTSTGTDATGDLTVTLSGTNAGSFALSKTTVTSIAANGTGSFTIVPDSGLSAGTYVATVTVDNENVDAASFDVKFTVNAADDTTVHTYKVTFSSGTGYSISGVTVPSFSINSDGSAKFTISVQSGYTLQGTPTAPNAKIASNGGNSYTISNVTTDTTISINVVKNADSSDDDGGNGGGSISTGTAIAIVACVLVAAFAIGSLAWWKMR